MRRTVASASAAALLIVSPAHAAPDTPEAVAQALDSDPVFVHPRVAGRLSQGERGQIRLAILRRKLGRIKVAVVSDRVAGRAGGLERFANQVDRSLDARGTLIAVAGPAYWLVTTYPQSEAAAAALRSAVAERDDDGLAAELLLAIPRIARVDPGPAADVGQPDEPRPSPGTVPDADDFLDDLGDAFRLGVLLVAAAIALPFLLVASLMVMRARRRRAREEEVREHGERSADDELIALGDEIRSLDLDTSMPGANRGALAEYEQALARYDQANELLAGDPTDYRVEQARAAIAAGRRHIEAARARLE